MTVFFYRVMFGEVPALFPSNSSRSCIRRMKWVHSLWAKSCKVHYSHLEDHSLQLSSEVSLLMLLFISSLRGYRRIKLCYNFFTALRFRLIL